MTTMVDNTFDALLASADGVSRTSSGAGRVPPGSSPMARRSPACAPSTASPPWSRSGPGTRAARCCSTPAPRRTRWRSTPGDSASTSAALQGVVLSHGHFDHAGGFDGLARLRGRSGLPLTVHPAIWTRRRLQLPGGRDHGDAHAVPGRPGARGVRGDRAASAVPAGRRHPDHRRGRPRDRVRARHAAGPPGLGRPRLAARPPVIDDQALVINVRGRGLVVVTGCGHAGVVNIIRHAMRLTGVSRLLAVIGGFHLSGPAFEPVIGPTVSALTELAPELIAPAHCTGWRAQHTLAAALAGRLGAVQRRHHLHAHRRLVPPRPGRGSPGSSKFSDLERSRP